MKLRHRAVPGDPIDSLTDQDHRLHLRLQVNEQTEKVFWFRKVRMVESLNMMSYAYELDDCDW